MTNTPNRSNFAPRDIFQRHLLVGLVVDELRALGGLLKGVIKSCT